MSFKFGTHIGRVNPFRYRGYYYDAETKLYYLESRYYDPEVGRFINADAVSYIDPETINGLNLYAYCGNNPVMNVDTEGCYLESYSERVDLISFLLEFSIGGSFALIASAVKTGVRPNNIGIGIFKKQQANYLAKLTKASRILGKVVTGLAIASVAFSVIDGINVDINRGYSIDRIVSNAAVNTAIYGGLAFGIGALGAKAGTLLGAIVPGIGNVIVAIVGFAVGIGIGILLEWQVNGKSIIDHIRDGVYNFWKWLFG